MQAFPGASRRLARLLGRLTETTTTYPRVHGDGGGRTHIDRPGRAVLRNGHHGVAGIDRLGSQARSLLAEEQHTRLGQIELLERGGSRDVVDADDGNPGLARPGLELVTDSWWRMCW
jgi:hypothetical protein